VIEPILGKITERCPSRHDYISRVGSVQAGQDAEKGRFSRSVRAGETDPVLIGYMPSDILKDGLAGETLGQFVDLKHEGKEKSRLIEPEPRLYHAGCHELFADGGGVDRC